MKRTFIELFQAVKDLGKAVEWMEGKKASISEIASRVGIENETYFYKMFKRRYGMTPRQYIFKKVVQDKYAPKIT